MNDPSVPFGGTRASGPGREPGPEGMAAPQSLQTIDVDPPAIG